MTLIAEGVRLPCCIDTGEAFEPKARYALRMLLVPLGFEPQWVERSRVAGGLYYGMGDAPPNAVRLAFSENAPRYFDALEPYDAQDAMWFDGPEGRVPVLFTSSAGDPDVVASTFLWLSGWDEYVSAKRDSHGRFPYAGSLTATLELAHRPVVDAYRELLGHELRDSGIRFQRRRWSGSDWAMCPTHDVDYLRKWRPGILYREFIQNLVLNRRRVRLRDRLARAAAAARQLPGDDPYRSALRRMPEEVRSRGGTATYFVKAGGSDPHDVPYSLESPFFQSWSSSLLSEGFEIGLHPSYRTPADEAMLKEEMKRLSEAVGRNITSVRHHYLRFDPVKTPHIHDSLGLAVDSTIGFAEHEGFRRATCLPFQLYDIEENRPLTTWEMPLAAMESALFTRRGLDLASAFDATRRLAEACRRYGGVFVGLWHNVLGDELEAPEWEAHFQMSLDYAAENGAKITTLSGALGGWQ